MEAYTSASFIKSAMPIHSFHTAMNKL